MNDVYQKFIGKRIRLISTNDEYTTIQSGDIGVITFVDDTGTIFADWEDDEVAKAGVYAMQMYERAVRGE